MSSPEPAQPTENFPGATPPPPPPAQVDTSRPVFERRSAGEAPPAQGQLGETPTPNRPGSPASDDSIGMRMLMPVGRSGWAIAAGYLGLISLIVIPAPFALIASILAIRDIRKSRAAGKQKYGMGRAIFGLIMGILGTIAIIFILIGASTLSHDPM